MGLTATLMPAPVSALPPVLAWMLQRTVVGVKRDVIVMMVSCLAEEGVYLWRTVGAGPMDSTMR